MNKHSFNLALQLYNSFEKIKEPLLDAFITSDRHRGFRKDFDLTPYYNRYIELSYSQNQKHYTFIFFPFRIFLPPMVNANEKYTPFYASQVYAFEKNDNVDFRNIKPSHDQSVKTEVLNFPYFYIKDKGYAFHTHLFYDYVSHDSLKFLSTLLESINENSINNFTGSFQFILFLKNIVASAILYL